MKINELYKAVESLCGHGKHIAVSVEIDRYSGRSEPEIRFSIYDSKIDSNKHEFESPDPKLALRTYEAELARIKYAIDDLDYEVKNV